MLGAIAGDVIGSVHEFIGTKSTDFELFVAKSRFTDDTVLAVAVADCLLNGRDYVDTFHEYVRAYPNAGYGVRFRDWARTGSRDPYNSWGNGSAMRVPAIGFAFSSLDDVLINAARSAEVTHNHPEGIKGAQATAAAIFMARQGATKPDIKDTIERLFEYRPESTARRCATDVHVQRILPGYGASGPDRVPRIVELRRCGPKGDLARRGRRYARVHQRRGRRSALRRRSSAHRRADLGAAGRSAASRRR